MSNCERCGGSLTRVPWNTKVDIGYCNNIGCEYYRRPVESYLLAMPAIEPLPVKSEESIHKESPKRKEKRRKAKKGVVEVRAQNGDLIAVANNI